jgi:hypothetical protein
MQYTEIDTQGTLRLHAIEGVKTHEPKAFNLQRIVKLVFSAK